MYEVGLSYMNGTGNKKDAIPAHQYLNLAVSRGYQKALPELQRLTQNMNRQQLLQAQKLAKAWKPKKVR